MTQSTEQATIWLSQDAFDKLTTELAELKGPVRTTIVERISAARDEGDLKENTGYHAAREELGKLEGKIRHIAEMLLRAEVGSAPVDDGTVAPGTVVTYRFSDEDDDEAETFLLGAREMEDSVEGMKVYSPQSPLGAALIGATVGETVSYAAPNGRKLQVVVLAAKPYAG